jgi:hypothetical protein
MRTYAKLAILVGLAGFGSGCTSDGYRRADGLTDGAGDKLAGNSVMQMVDPWQDGVQNTKLLVPAARGANAGAADEAADTGASQSTTSAD